MPKSSVELGLFVLEITISFLTYNSLFVNSFYWLVLNIDVKHEQQ